MNHVYHWCPSSFLQKWVVAHGRVAHVSNGARWSAEALKKIFFASSIYVSSEIENGMNQYKSWSSMRDTQEVTFKNFEILRIGNISEIYPSKATSVSPFTWTGKALFFDVGRTRQGLMSGVTNRSIYRVQEFSFALETSQECCKRRS